MHVISDNRDIQLNPTLVKQCDYFSEITNQGFSPKSEKIRLESSTVQQDSSHQKDCSARMKSPRKPSSQNQVTQKIIQLETSQPKHCCQLESLSYSLSIFCKIQVKLQKDVIAGQQPGCKKRCDSVQKGQCEKSCDMRLPELLVLQFLSSTYTITTIT